jgi:hypothetical protein
MTICHKRLALTTSLALAFLGIFCTEGRPRAPISTQVDVSRLVKPIKSNEALSGVVLRVTTLDADGVGSLRRALDDSRPRLVVFEVGGVIDLHGEAIAIRHPHLIVAGQTAPDPGIALIRGALVIETSDVTLEHIAARSGNFYPDDALGARRASSGPVHDVVFDHCSATWGVDENLSVSGPRDPDAALDPDATSHDVTLRSCLIAEGLSHSIHAKGEHSKGTLIHDGVRNVSIVGCLYAHNSQRNPRLKGGTTSSVIGNVIYNWGTQCVGVGAAGNKRMLAPAQATLTGNVAIAGADTRSMVLVKSVDPGAKVTLRDDVAVDPRGRSLPLADEDVVITRLSNDASAAWLNAERVLRTAGSRPARRDPIDTRIVQSVIDGTGRIIDSQDQVGGYPVRAATKRALVVPDARRDEWLQRMSDALAVDRAIDPSPLRKRLRVAPVRASSSRAARGSTPHS